MKQSNNSYTNPRNWCRDTVNKSVIEYLEKIKFPKPSQVTWDSLLSNSFKKTDYYFLKLMLKNEVHENSFYIDKDIENTIIEQKCSGGIIPEEVIHFSKIKVALIQKHLRLIINALDAYEQIIQRYDELPQKTHITQKIIDRELSDSIVLTEIINTLSEEQSNREELSAYKDNLRTHHLSEYSHLESAKSQGVPFKELRRKYPTYRSQFKVATEFIDCIEIYSYYFFLNNFTYDTQEKAAEFTYSTIEYIKSIIYQSEYTPSTLSNYRNFLDKISKFKENLPYSLKYEDVIQCDMEILDDNLHIGLYFPHTGNTYVEQLLNNQTKTTT